jgi:SRSO17 transposase
MLDELMDRVAGRFSRVEPRRRARAFVLGLLADLPRKNCWIIAEHAGDAAPGGMQHFLARARWDADAVRDDVRGYVIEHLGDPGAVLVVDEAGDLKKGAATAGVRRQYTGTAGRAENAQVAVYLSYAGRGGHALIDRELYVPKSWTADPARCRAAGIPAEAGFATKPALARAMIARTLDAGVPAAWVTGDEVYGADPGLRADLEDRRAGYVLAVACDHHVAVAAGKRRADELAACLPRSAWQRYSADPGAQGHRCYDWALISLAGGRPGHHWLLIRRSRRTRELAFYRCYSPRPAPLPVLVQVAGRRWTVEENFQAGKGLTGLDQHQVRRWASWYLGHPGYARGRLPHHRRRHRDRSPRRSDPADSQREKPPAHRHDHPASQACRSAGLVRLAPPPSVPRPDQPLPAASRHRTMKITIYSWSTKERATLLATLSLDPRAP